MTTWNLHQLYRRRSIGVTLLTVLSASLLLASQDSAEAQSRISCEAVFLKPRAQDEKIAQEKAFSLLYSIFYGPLNADFIKNRPQDATNLVIYNAHLLLEDLREGKAIYSEHVRIDVLQRAFLLSKPLLDLIQSNTIDKKTLQNRAPELIELYMRVVALPSSSKDRFSEVLTLLHRVQKDNSAPASSPSENEGWQTESSSSPSSAGRAQLIGKYAQAQQNAGDKKPQNTFSLLDSPQGSWSRAAQALVQTTKIQGASVSVSVVNGPLPDVQIAQVWQRLATAVDFSKIENRQFTVLRLEDRLKSKAIQSAERTHPLLTRAPKGWQGAQVLSSVKPQDQVLLKSAQLDQNPHEVAQIRILGADNSVLAQSSVIEGSQNNVDAAPLFAEMQKLLTKRYQEAGTFLPLLGVEIAHVHTIMEVSAGLNHQLAVWPLSGSDYDLAAHLSRQLPEVPIFIRAVVGNGYAYEAVFRSGTNVTEEYYK